MVVAVMRGKLRNRALPVARVYLRTRVNRTDTPLGMAPLSPEVGLRNVGRSPVTAERGGISRSPLAHRGRLEQMDKKPPIA